MMEQKKTVLLDLDAIDARVDAASVGPWQRSRFVPSSFTRGWSKQACKDAADHEYRVIRGPGVVGESSCNPVIIVSGKNDADRDFIAHARADVPALVAEVRRLRIELEEAQLRSIEARNPGIDIEEVRKRRAGNMR